MDNIIIRSMKEEDSSEVLEMMKVFYASPALLSDPSEDVMKRDIADCLGAVSYTHLDGKTPWSFTLA